MQWVWIFLSMMSCSKGPGGGASEGVSMCSEDGGSDSGMEGAVVTVGLFEEDGSGGYVELPQDPLVFEVGAS